MEKGDSSLNLSGLLPDFTGFGSYPDTPEQLSALFVVALIIVASIFFIVSIRALIKSLSGINWLRELIDEETSKTVVKNRYELREQAEEVSHHVGHLWKEFDETLVEAEIAGDIHLHNIYDASHFFNSSTLARGITESRMLAAVPGFLTALGVIGTFVGLQLGLSELNLGENATVDKMMQGVAGVIGGAKIAFMTSVWGVSLSVLFNFIEKGLERIARDKIHMLQMRIDELFPRFSAESQLQRIANDGSQSRESLQGLAERIGEKMQESLYEATTGIQQGLEASLEKIMAPAINKLVNETSDGNQKALEQLVERFMDRFGEEGRIQREAMDDASKGVGEALSVMSSRLNDFVSHLERNQAASSEREAELVKTISEQVNGLVAQGNEQTRLMTDFVGSQFRDISQSIERTNKAQEDRERVLSERFESTINDVGNSMQEHISSSAALVSQGEGLQKQIESSLSSYDSVIAAVQQSAAEINHAAESMREYGSMVKTSSEQLGGVLRRAADSTEALASENQRASVALEQVHRRIDESIAHMSQVVERLGGVIDTADTTFDHLTEHQNNYLNALKLNVSDLSEHMTQLLGDYAERANTQTSEHLNVWAEHTTNYAEQMNAAARSLAEVVDEIEVKLGA